MKKLLPLFLYLGLTAGTCQRPGNIVDDSCVANSTVCRNGRPYVCAEGVWRTVGDTSCVGAGGVCCMTRAGVHACVAPTSCVAEGGVQ